MTPECICYPDKWYKKNDTDCVYVSPYVSRDREFD